MATSQTTLSHDQIRILALRALVKERSHRILRRQRRFNLGGAISSVTTTATRGTTLSQKQCFALVKAECERLLRLDDISADVLLQAAQEWEALSEEDKLSRTIIVTPAFASLIRASKRRKQKSVTAERETLTLF